MVTGIALLAAAFLLWGHYGNRSYLRAVGIGLLVLASLVSCGLDLMTNHR